MKYTVDVLLTNEKELTFTDVEAKSEKEAIDQISSFEETFVVFKKDSAYYKINEAHIIGYEVTSSSDAGSDSESEDEPVKQALN